MCGISHLVPPQQRIALLALRLIPNSEQLLEMRQSLPPRHVCVCEV